jgi:hypothetical protein
MGWASLLNTEACKFRITLFVGPSTIMCHVLFRLRTVVCHFPEKLALIFIFSMGWLVKSKECMFLNDALFMCFIECVSRNESLELYHVLKTLEWSWACGGNHASAPYCWKVNNFFFFTTCQSDCDFAIPVSLVGGCISNLL